jgi:hypothetical protein
LPASIGRVHYYPLRRSQSSSSTDRCRRGVIPKEPEISGPSVGTV